MEQPRIKRGAWRRSPVLPRALTVQGGATLASSPGWTETRAEARRAPDQMGLAAAYLPPEALYVEPEDLPAEVAAALAPVVEEASDEEAFRPSEARVRLGGCLCGTVRYETHGAPKLVELCHCADCR